MKVFELMSVLCPGQRVLILELGAKTHFVDPDSVFTKENTPLGIKRLSGYEWTRMDGDRLLRCIHERLS